MSLQNQIIETLIINLKTDKEIFEFVRSVDAALRLHKGATIDTYVKFPNRKPQQKETIQETPKSFNKKPYIKKEKPTYPINPKSPVPYISENGSTNILQSVEIPSDLGMYIDFSIKDSQAIEPIKPVQQN